MGGGAGVREAGWRLGRRACQLGASVRRGPRRGPRWEWEPLGRLWGWRGLCGWWVGSGDGWGGWRSAGRGGGCCRGRFGFGFGASSFGGGAGLVGVVKCHLSASDAHLGECLDDAEAQLLEGPYGGGWGEVGPTEVSAAGMFREGVLPDACGLVGEADRVAS